MYTIIILLEIFLTLALFVHSTPLEDPVIFGHNLAIRFTGVANEVIEKGAIMSFYHDQSGKVDHEADFCKDFVEQSGFACPVEGDLDLTSTMYLESSPEEPKNVSENVYTKMIPVIQGFEHGITGLAHNLPNVIGAMDGLHIPIHPPSKNGARFVNRSVHDARVFYRSSLYHEISHNPEQWVPDSFFNENGCGTSIWAIKGAMEDSVKGS
ncbi:662_t:CDS:2 [Funneliformis geosporum]|uniref:662_t:CDS:1 n=1 Tax=Funneliformis geosporum TaxID=1117311 RepID=A0A9W4T1L2_9GLOM|nr:662_t:CDS:2 [Funneliformis geosporum]